MFSIVSNVRLLRDVSRTSLLLGSVGRRCVTAFNRLWADPTSAWCCHVLLHSLYNAIIESSVVVRTAFPWLLSVTFLFWEELSKETRSTAVWSSVFAAAASMS